MSDISVTTLDALDTTALAAAFNRVYEEYIIPFHMDEQAVRRHVELNDITLDRSPLLLDENRDVVGLAALGVRGDRGWIGGFGVVQSYRGRGLGTILMSRVLDHARELELRVMQLEVLTNNPIAIQLYERTGFVTVRRLLIFIRDADSEPHAASPHDVEVVDVHAGLQLLAELHDERPAWQRESWSLEKLPGLTALRLRDAAVVYRESDSGAVNLWDIAGSDEDVDALLDALALRFPDRSLILLNEPEDSPVSRVLRHRSWQEPMAQYEMQLRLEA